MGRVINLFRGEYNWLSNFYPAEVELAGTIYPSVEHAYQAAKTLDRDFRRKILATPHPGVVKRMGKTCVLRKDWDNIRVDIMRNLLILKFRDPVLRKKLSATGDTTLVEGNLHGDTFWGVDMKKGSGKNTLGVLLMEIRKNIKEEPANV